MSEEIKNIKEELREIKRDMKYIEGEYTQWWKLARAINEIQDEMRKLNPKVSFINDIYAPTQVGNGR